MAYTAEITRQQPACILVLIDQSESMEDPFGAPNARRTKAEGAADAVNRTLENLLLRCTKGLHDIRDYFHVGVVGYGAAVVSGLTVPDAKPDDPPPLVPMSQLPDLVLKLDIRRRQQADANGIVTLVEEPYPIYVEPTAVNGTPMCEAFQLAYAMLETWIGEHLASFPPIVINITDGEASDGNPQVPAQSLRGLATSDGNVLLFNCHLSSHRAPAVVLHDDDQDLVDDYARQLFVMSSPLPDSFRQAALRQGFGVNGRTRGFAFNADLVDLIKFLDIGTRPANVRV